MNSTSSSNAMSALFPMMGIVFVSFLAIGLGLPVLPLHVHGALGFSAFVVGLATGSQFAASLVSRVWAGRHADSRGPKRAVIVGLLASAASGLLYLVSLALPDQPAVAITVLLAGRGILGAGESFIITGAQAWGVAISGPGKTGTVLAFMGTAMYAAFAAGAPLGTSLYNAYGFAAIALATLLMPLATLALALPMRRVDVPSRAQASLTTVVKAVWAPGAGLALSSVGFGAMLAFASLLFAGHGWAVWPAFTLFAGAFIVARLVLAHVTDSMGGAKVALLFVIIEAAGQFVLWFAPSAAIAWAGATLTGLGYSLVYPAFGVEAMRRAPATNRGLAMGAYTAFLDVTLGIATPALGVVGNIAGIDTIFLASAITVLCAAGVAAWLMSAGASTTINAARPSREASAPVATDVFGKRLR